MKDHDRGKSFEKATDLGHASLALDDLPEDISVTKLLTLQGREKGQILVSLTAIGFGVKLGGFNYQMRD